MLGEGPDTVLMEEAEMWYTGTSIVRKGFTLGSYMYSGSMPRTLRKSCVCGGGVMREVPLYMGYLTHKEEPPPRTLQ